MIDTIKRMKLQHTMRGEHPTKITFSSRGIAELRKNLAQYDYLVAEGYAPQEICGLVIEEVDELKNGALFTIS